MIVLSDQECDIIDIETWNVRTVGKHSSESKGHVRTCPHPTNHFMTFSSDQMTLYDDRVGQVSLSSIQCDGLEWNSMVPYILATHAEPYISTFDLRYSISDPLLQIRQKMCKTISWSNVNSNLLLAGTLDRSVSLWNVTSAPEKIGLGSHDCAGGAITNRMNF